MKNNSKMERQKKILEQALETRTKELEAREQWLEAEKEAELSESEIDNLYASFKERLHNEGLVDEDGNPTEKAQILSKKLEAQEMFRAETEELNRKAKKSAGIRGVGRYVAKAAAMVLVVGACVFGLSMTSRANRMFWMEKAEEIWNGWNTSQINNSDNRNYSIAEEYDAKLEIAEKLGVEVPEFYYIPKGMTYEKYEIAENGGEAFLEYNYNESFLYLSIANNRSNRSRSFEQNEVAFSVDLDLKADKKIHIEVLDLSDNGLEQYLAQWNYNNVYYDFGGRISKSEIISVLKEMHYNL